MQKIGKIFGIFLILLGVGLYLYPVIMTENLNKESKTYVKQIDHEYLENQNRNFKKDPFYQKIKKYNKSIYENGQKDFKDAWSYTQFPIPLDGFEEERCGYIKIPAMDVKLPLYIRATESNMAKGAAVLGQTSIPIGGKNTNAVIAGHRGYQGAPYFREIEKLKAGDKVIIKNKWQKLTYRVTGISIIEPTDSEAVKIQPGKDMITLLTCHPYRSHGKYRYVVYCERDHGQKISKDIKIDAKPFITFQSSEPDIHREQIVRLIAFVIIILCVIRVFRRKS